MQIDPWESLAECKAAHAWGETRKLRKKHQGRNKWGVKTEQILELKQDERHLNSNQQERTYLVKEAFLRPLQHSKEASERPDLRRAKLVLS